MGSGRPDADGVGELTEQLAQYAEVGITQAHLMPIRFLRLRSFPMAEYLVPALETVWSWSNNGCQAVALSDSIGINDADPGSEVVAASILLVTHIK